jgi:hypothetical protein
VVLFSASQVKTYRQCVRKWALEKLAGLRGPETASQTLGKDVDDNYLQPYLRDGKPIDTSTRAGKIAASGLDWLPKPQWRGLEVQKKFIIDSPSKKWGYLGYQDLWLPYGGQPGFFDDKPVVADFKTTKSIRKWALNEEALRKDVQAQLYSVWAILETKSKEINLSWLYLQTEGTAIALPTQITVHTDEVADQFMGIEKDAKEMLAIREALPKGKDPQEYALSIPGNKNACSDYGGCPFQHLCFQLEDLIDAPKCAVEEKTMSGTIDLFAKLKKKAQATEATQSPTVPEANAPEAAQPPSTPPAQDQIAAEPALGINPPMPEGTPPAPPVGTVEAKPKRGRPKGSVNKVEQAQVVTDTAAETSTQVKGFDEESVNAAVDRLAQALKDFIKAVQS